MTRFPLAALLGLWSLPAAASGPWVPMDYEAVSMDVLKGVCPAPSCRPVDQAVLRSTARKAHLGLLLDGRLARTGHTGAVALAGGWAWRTPRLLAQLGAQVQAEVAEHTRVQPGPWLSLTALPAAPAPRTTGLWEDLRHSELTLELRGALSPSTVSSTLAARIGWSFGSPELRAGAVVETGATTPPGSRAGPGPAWAGLQIEVRPTLRPGADSGGKVR